MKRSNYRQTAEDHLLDNPRCKRDPRHKATTVHHVMGREGYADDWARENDIPLVIDKRFFASLCLKCHNWVHANEDDPEVKEKGLYIKRSQTDMK